MSITFIHPLSLREAQALTPFKSKVLERNTITFSIYGVGLRCLAPSENLQEV